MTVNVHAALASEKASLRCECSATSTTTQNAEPERSQGRTARLTTPKRGAHGVRPTGQICPECGMKSVTRQSLPLPAPVPPKGSCVVACGKCGYTAVVETKTWEAGCDG